MDPLSEYCAANGFATVGMSMATAIQYKFPLHIIEYMIGMGVPLDQPYPGYGLVAAFVQGELGIARLLLQNGVVTTPFTSGDPLNFSLKATHTHCAFLRLLREFGCDLTDAVHLATLFLRHKSYEAMDMVLDQLTELHQDDARWLLGTAIKDNHPTLVVLGLF